GLKTGNGLFFETDRFLRAPSDMRKLSRTAGAGLVWLSRFEETNKDELPTAWKGDGPNPIVIFRGGLDDRRQFYFGGKGGKGTVPHGHLDAGSFVFELDGVRWSMDQGMQSYSALEETGFNLWGRNQDSDRWTLQAYNNFGHSTLTVDEGLHAADGFASLMDFQPENTAGNPEATFAMTDVFGGAFTEATRRFVKEGSHSLLIEDNLSLAESTKLVTWQLVTTADVIPVKGGAILEKDGKRLNLEILSPANVEVSVISLTPPPMALDKHIEDLKRIEIRVPDWVLDQRQGSVRVRLSGREE
ncbi:MAG: heparinase II/III family protein, partial [Balneolales bacterium]